MVVAAGPELVGTGLIFQTWEAELESERAADTRALLPSPSELSEWEHIETYAGTSRSIDERTTL